MESVTCTVKLKLPWLLGLPVIIPFEERLRPGGREPAEIVHEYGDVPPEAAMGALYEVPTVALGREAVVTCNGTGAGVGAGVDVVTANVVEAMPTIGWDNLPPIEP